MPPPSGSNALLINAVVHRQRPYRSDHPLAIPRTTLAIELIRSYGAVNADEVVAGRLAREDELAGYHTSDYIAALRAAEANRGLAAGDRERFGLGTAENPYFDHLYSIPARATGGSIQAAEAVIGGAAAFNPAGGMHHARPAAARGFCYFNDPVLAVLRLRRAGWRVLYVDIDAHHGDGVEAAFRDTPDVFTLSLHMDTGYAYPYRGGRLADHGSRAGAYTTLNVPLPAGTNDAEYRLLFDTAWEPVMARFAPDAVVLQAGTDALARDPLGKLGLSTQGFLDIARAVIGTAPRHVCGTPRLAVLGGGGYHPLLVARAWCGLWGLLSGRELPPAIPAAGTRILRGARWARDSQAAYFEGLFLSRLDHPTDARVVRPEIKQLAARLRRHPYLGGARSGGARAPAPARRVAGGCA